MRQTKNFERGVGVGELDVDWFTKFCFSSWCLVPSWFHAHVKVVGSRSAELIAGFGCLAFFHHGWDVSTVGQAVVGNHGHDHRAVCKSGAAALDLHTVKGISINGGSSGKRDRRHDVEFLKEFFWKEWYVVNAFRLFVCIFYGKVANMNMKKKM